MGPGQALGPGTGDKVSGTFDGAWLTRPGRGTRYMESRTGEAKPPALTACHSGRSRPQPQVSTGMRGK
ncbi:hypothetical protein P170DRAFT_431557 [Aspergillus steynii IBT 23096]|uniref:Uncharacterized protein n=1 Tax=Aspergillus steynii IBT 23096 TaxID=1392250 RepID=A0A2I2GLJ2_9EURO|nr:uncharacterized protein P170DRAFT_431557 [Aspergillus steynii IBT 23096]PLB53743.1 hypothetical protein P170DRAFT_431557 [Aspergillus steynii IBT 23096]